MRGLRRIGDERSAVTVARTHEACGYILAEQCDLGTLGAVARSEHTSGVAVVRGVAERRIGATIDTCQII